MIPVPFIVLGVAATTLVARYLRKNLQIEEAIDGHRNGLEKWCINNGLKPEADGSFDWNAHLPDGTPLIIEALNQNRNDIFELLMAQQVDVNVMNSEGKTALFYCKNCIKIEKLIKAGADVNARDLQGRTVLFGCRDVKVARLLLKYGADLLIQDDEGKTVLHALSLQALSTAENDLYNLLKLKQIYITYTPILLNIVDNIGNKAEISELYLNEEQYKEVLDDDDKKKLLKLSPNELLEDAVEYGKYYLAKIALERGADPNCRRRSLIKWNMLLLAVKNNNPHLISLLVQYGADVNVKCEDISIIMHAVMGYHHECVQELLDCGAKLDEDTVNWAKFNKHPEIFSMIFKTDRMPVCDGIPKRVILKTYPKNLLNQYLITAVNEYDIEAVHRLLDSGADPNAVENGKGVLAIAAVKNAPEIIQALIDAGADINKKYEYDFTALCYACCERHARCVELLLKFGAKVEDYSLENNGCACIREIWKNYKSRSEM